MFKLKTQKTRGHTRRWKKRKLAYSKECQIPPEELPGFERLWDKEAGDRCLECNAAINRGENFCRKHTKGEYVVICGQPTFVDDVLEKQCEGVTKYMNGYYVCELCGHNKELSQSAISSGGPLQTMIEQYEKGSRTLHNRYASKKRALEHVPEWANRQRP